MYEIISAGALVALCEKPRYIKVNEATGLYVEATASDAVGLSVAGTLYNLNGGTAIPDAPDAIVREGSAPDYIFRNRVQIEENADTTAAAIVGVEDAVCELDTATDARMTAVEDALCELDGIINGGGEN